MFYLVFMIVIGIFIFVLNSYQTKKKNEYQNDERWKIIQIKANQVVNRYYEALTVLIIMAYAITAVLYDVEVTISLGRILEYAMWVLFLKNPVEYFALRYFDNTL